jgi:two-component system response regulator VicR
MTNVNEILPQQPEPEALTTGQAAKLCGVNFRTVSRWIDRGLLPAYQLPGTRGDRRVRVEDLRRFMREHDMPDPWAAAPSVRRALVVDDEPSMARAIERVLRQAGYETALAGGGFEAGAMLFSFQPHVMTLDLRMPGMDGIEVLKFLQRTALPVPLKVVVVSADSEERLQQARELGAHAVLPKPFANEVLLATLASFH